MVSDTLYIDLEMAREHTYPDKKLEDTMISCMYTSCIGKQPIFVVLFDNIKSN